MKGVDPAIHSIIGLMQRLSACVGALLLIGGAFAKSDLIGTWDTARGLQLTLRADGRFAMGPRPKIDGMEGTWKMVHNTLQLRTDTLDGHPVDAELKRQLGSASVSKMSPQQRADTLAMLRRDLDMDIEIDNAGKRLTWLTNGQAAIFTRAEKSPIPYTESQITSGLRKGMPIEAVMDFFRTDHFSASSPGDPLRLTSDFIIHRGKGSQRLRLTFLKKKGRPGLESVHIVNGSKRRSVGIH